MASHGEVAVLDVSPDAIGTVTHAVLEEVAAWQERRLDRSHLPVFDSIN